ncbi:cytochrome P450 6g1-like [Phlebotomus argentipes]|uniref:cytochrome P450 6g1-like n=1 Tax=Phlebotomus argentipes TaxID=94469 RepID=UPI0028929B5C|nr:cytochrome P450 6g1-like [Phlebotomus argentipes]
MLVVEVILGLLICIVGFLWWWQRSSRNFWEKNGVSYIPGYPLIGVLKDTILFRKNFGEFLMELYNNDKCKDDPITGVYFFHKPSLIIRHPEIIKNVLVKDFQYFVDRRISSDPHEDGIGRENLFSAKGTHWKNLRMKVSPVFTTGKLKNLFTLMLEVCTVLDQKLSAEIGREPKEYEMKELAGLFSTDTISICAFGVKANSLLNPEAEFRIHAKRATDFTWRRAMEFTGCFLLPELATLLRFSFFSKETNNFMRSTINYVMEERLRTGVKRNDLIDALITMREEDAELFKGDTLIAQAAVFLIAGYETSASATSFALYELARHQDIQDELRKEIRSYAEKYGDPKYETFNEMEYLQMVVHETIRLYPSLPFLDRICSPPNGAKSYSLEPYHHFAIPRGMPVYIPMLPIHRDPNHYPNPEQFIPERFNPKNKDSIDQYSYLSFGIGPRNCIGGRFGTFQVKLALYTILKDYRVEVCEKTPAKVEFDEKSLIIHPKEQLYLNVTRI